MEVVGQMVVKPINDHGLAISYVLQHDCDFLTDVHIQMHFCQQSLLKKVMITEADVVGKIVAAE